MKQVKAAALAFALLGTLVTSAFAGNGPHTIPAACQADAARLCPGLAPGDHQYNHCMNQRKPEVSKECRAAAKAARGKPVGKPGGQGQVVGAPAPG